MSREAYKSAHEPSAWVFENKPLTHIQSCLRYGQTEQHIEIMKRTLSLEP